MNDKKHTDNKEPKDYFEKNITQAPINIENYAGVTPPNEQNDLFSGEIKDIDTWLKYVEFKLKKEDKDAERKLKKQDRKAERNLRSIHAQNAFTFSKVWAFFIGSLIICKGFLSNICLEIEMFNRILKVENIFKLDTAEFLFIIGTLTGSIFAFYIFVLRYLFYRQGFFDDDKKDT